VIGALLLPVSAIALHAGVIVWDGLHDESAAADVAVILGNEVLADGTPSPRLRARLDRGLALLRAGQVRALIVSGGRGAAGLSEAAVMREYLLAEGAPEAAILLDPEGTNTYKTAVNTSRLMREQGFESAVMVSQYYHITRSKLAMRRVGEAAVTGAHADFTAELRDPWSLLREVAGYWLYRLASDEVLRAR
jgi:vancomycin permeability regulator SanA